MCIPRSMATHQCIAERGLQSRPRRQSLQRVHTRCGKAHHRRCGHDSASTPTARSLRRQWQTFFADLSAGRLMAARPRPRCRTRGASGVVRSHYRAPSRIPRFQRVLWGLVRARSQKGSMTGSRSFHSSLRTISGLTVSSLATRLPWPHIADNRRGSPWRSRRPYFCVAPPVRGKSTVEGAEGAGKDAVVGAALSPLPLPLPLPWPLVDVVDHAVMTAVARFQSSRQ